MAAKLGGDDDSPIADINVTPFVDIILVVLIIFMVTTPIMMKPSINIQLPKAASGDASAPTQLSIAIGAKGELNLNGKVATEAEISTQAATLSRANPDIQAVIAADKDTPHGVVVNMMDLIKTAGVHKFAISTDKK
jgi:biopolymer transport protein ExbD